MKEYRYRLCNANARASGSRKAVQKTERVCEIRTDLSAYFVPSKQGRSVSGGGGMGGTICAADSKGRQYGKQKECFKRKNLPLILNY